MEARAAVRLLIADPSAIVRDGLSAALATMEDVRVVGQAADSATTLEAAERELPDVVLLDLGLVERDRRLLRAIVRRSPGTAVIVLSALENENAIQAALAAGAHAHLSKAAFREQLIAAVDGCRAPSTVQAAPAAALDAREIAILSRVARGATDGEIAAGLGLSEPALQAELALLLRKLGVAERAQAAIAALKLGALRL